MARTIAKDHQEKRGLILRVAAATFAERGFDRASMSEVAAAAGISKANIYHYYDGKDALLFDILDNKLSTLEQRVTGIDMSGLEPSEMLFVTLQEILLSYRGADNEHRLQANAIPALPPPQQEILKSHQRRVVEHLAGILAAIAPAAFEDDRKKLRAATMSVFGMVNWFYMWNSRAGEKAREEYARLVTDLTVNGLKGL